MSFSMTWVRPLILLSSLFVTPFGLPAIAEDRFSALAKDEQECGSLALSQESKTASLKACNRLLAYADESKASENRFATLYGRRAFVLRSLERFDEAIADYTTAMKRSADESYYIPIGDTYLLKKDYHGALDAFDAPKSLQASESVIWGRATALEGLGRKDEAIAAYERFDKEFGGNTTMGRFASQKANDALIRLGARKPSEPIAAPAPASAATPCAAQKKTFDDTRAKASSARDAGGKTAACPFLRALGTEAYLYCVCKVGESRAGGCMDETDKLITEAIGFKCPIP